MLSSVKRHKSNIKFNILEVENIAVMYNYYLTIHHSIILLVLVLFVASSFLLNGSNRQTRNKKHNTLEQQDETEEEGRKIGRGRRRETGRGRDVTCDREGNVPGGGGRRRWM